MTDRRAAVLAIGMLFAAGCGGGGGGGGSHPPTTPTSATTRQAVSNAGGSVSVNFGIYTATVNVPAGALPTSTTVSITLYSPGHGPATLSSTQRSTRALGTGATELAEVVIDTGNEAPVLPLKISLIGVATPPTGTIIRLAGYGTAHGFEDIDTVTLSGNAAVEDNTNQMYPGASLASDTLYGFYEIPAANVTPAPPPVITISNATVAAAATTQLMATETNGNGFPFLVKSLTFSLSGASVGSITSSGSLTTGALDAKGTVTVTDTTAGRGNPSSTVNITVLSARPGATNDSFAFSGTTSSTTTLTNVTGPQTQAGTVTLTSTPGVTTVSGQTAQVTSSSAEVDTYALQTISTNTTTVTNYGLSGAASPVTLASTDATDSNGAEYINQYNSGNGLIDVLPETAGSFGPNNAALTYTENDPAYFTTAKTVNADGSYTENDTDSFGNVGTITLNTNLSGSYDATQFDDGLYTFGAPTGSPATIAISVTYNGQTQSKTLPSWIPAGATPSSETDVDNGTTAFPVPCAVPARYGTSGNQIVQTIHRYDAALGNAETETLTTYTTPGYGPVCTVMTDHVASYYDFNGLHGHLLSVTPDGVITVAVTDIAETLTLTSATTSVGTLAKTRSTAGSSPATSLRPLAFARSRFERVVRDRLKTISAIFHRRTTAPGAQFL